MSNAGPPQNLPNPPRNQRINHTMSPESRYMIPGPVEALDVLDLPTGRRPSAVSAAPRSAEPGHLRRIERESLPPWEVSPLKGSSQGLMGGEASRS